MTSVENCDDLEIGQLVAVFCEDCTSDPAIGECVELGEEEIELRWLQGTYSSSWSPYRVPDPHNRRRKMDWRQKVPRKSILLYSFTLTTTKHLRKHTVLSLKKLYDQARMQ